MDIVIDSDTSGLSDTMTQIGDLLASITGESSPTTAAFPPPRRLASDDLRRSTEKLQKPDTQPANISRPIIKSRKLPAVLVPTFKTEAHNGRSILHNSATSTFKNGQPTPPPTNDPSKPPKKGSFAEIMARGKAVQSTLGQVGKIQHKKIEKLPSKRDREALLAQRGKSIQKGVDLNSKFGGGVVGRIHDKTNFVKSTGKSRPPKPLEPEKKVKKAAIATTGYAGTARPKPGDSNNASQSFASSSRGKSKAPSRVSSRGPQYEYISEEEEDEDMEDQEDCYSDESDMEAAAFEVDEEEELAARIARKEDAEALAEENRLKREKLEKKRKLEALAKKAPGQRY